MEFNALAAKRCNIAQPAQRHVIALFISFVLSYDVFIQNVSNKRVVGKFLLKCTKILLVMTGSPDLLY